ncbi:hypothetical protein BH11VER1_BH11VER1_42460 [soil metagenome]
MDTLLTSFRTLCLEALLDLLWRQWCSLGVAGHSTPASTDRLIDPEALLLVTTSIGRHEPRLFDEALDWLARYGSFMNIQRLKNLQRSTALGEAQVLACVADWLSTHSTQQAWKSLARAEKASLPVQPLFIGSAGPANRQPDPHFLAHGLERDPFQPRGMSRAPNSTLPPNFVLSLRALIGVTARVEIILCLASGGAAHAAELARITGYAPRTLQALLQDMSLSGHILSQEPATASGAKQRKGSNRRYHLQPKDWHFLSQGRPLPKWTPWAALFSLTRTVIDAIPGPEEKTRHPAVISSKLRAALATHGQALAAAGMLPHLDLRPEATGEELIETLATRLPELLTRL